MFSHFLHSFVLILLFTHFWLCCGVTRFPILFNLNFRSIQQSPVMHRCRISLKDEEIFFSIPIIGATLRDKHQLHIGYGNYFKAAFEVMVSGEVDQINLN